MITIHFTEQEAQQLLNVLTQLPIPFNVSQPLVQKIGQAIAHDQQMQMQRESSEAMQSLGMMGQAVGPVGDIAGAVRSIHPRTRPVPVDDGPRPLVDGDFEPEQGPQE